MIAKSRWRALMLARGLPARFSISLEDLQCRRTSVPGGDIAAR
jgi:hypothetical protein